MRRQRAEGRDDRSGGSLPLHPRLAYDDLRSWEAHSDRRHEIAPSCRVGSGEDPDGAGDAREPTLALQGEEALGRELALQLLEGLQVAAEAEPLDRGCPKREHGLLLE